MADDGSQQRKPDFRTAVEDVEALATVLVMKLESVLGRRLKLRSPAVLATIGVLGTIVLAVGVVIALLQTGNAKAVSDNAALIGALVALGGVFTTQLVNSELEARRAQSARESQQIQWERELELEQQRFQTDTLQGYFDRMLELLMEGGLRYSVENDGGKSTEARILVRTRTLTVLRTLNPDRKANVVRFLMEAGLIRGPEPIIPLFEADLSDAKLSNAYLPEADLHDAKLTGADLSGANLSGAQLYSAYEVADLSGADLSSASLSGANLFRAILKDTNLEEANLEGAELSGANLNRANLRGAYDGFNSDGSRRLLANEKLEEQAKSLEGATMPDGQKYEVWLKDKEGSGKDMENE